MCTLSASTIVTGATGVLLVTMMVVQSASTPPPLSLCGDSPAEVYKCSSAPVNARVDALLSLMTVTEKVAQLLNPIMDVSATTSSFD